ncbi:GntR family transcriptional regulator [Rubellimicrobium rubrum]|uniref:GntR family transcriptional regulator n=1 Tax=Rubellimicrobium rubrum TaxID=2585369 RepID=A0A5C4MPI9_9RHOB|nr:GntR family transcriptional regulator [Rubellimicrobium rubrum]TNC47507.1 GntR family transcriptional regulator [Rubellimicrobium rubrum]
MARTDARFREAFNSLLDLCGGLTPGDSLPSEAALAEQMNVSRTIVRGALRDLDERGLLRWEGRSKLLVRPPKRSDRIELRGDSVTLGELETRFLDWILRFDVPADTPLNITQLARQFGVTPYTLQEFLSGWSRFGLVQRRPRGGWLLLGFTADYAVELSDFRAILETDAVRHLVALPPEHPVWSTLESLRVDHHALLDRIETEYHDFSKLDERFHAAVTGVVRNRFVVEFQKVISLIFHYHFQWDKTDERQRNEAAIREHLQWIKAMQRRDEGAAVAAARAHLATSKQTLLSSLRGHNLA